MNQAFSFNFSLLYYSFSDLKVPTVVVLNTSNQQYFLPHKPIESTEDVVQFINEILEGAIDVSLLLWFKVCSPLFAFPDDSYQFLGPPCVCMFLLELLASVHSMFCFVLSVLKSHLSETSLRAPNIWSKCYAGNH